MSRVALDLHGGVARLDGIRVAVAPVGEGALRVAGAVLRPLTFGERDRAVRGVAAAGSRRAAVGAAVRRAATVSPGEVEDLVAEILAMHLAGARDDGEDADFDETLIRVARATGWRPDEIDGAEAALVDRLAARLGPAGDDGWTRVVFRAAGDGLEGLRDALADALLARAGATPATPDAEASSPAAAADTASAARRAPSWLPPVASPAPVTPPAPSVASSRATAAVRAAPGAAPDGGSSVDGPRPGARLVSAAAGGVARSSDAAAPSVRTADESRPPDAVPAPSRARSGPSASRETAAGRSVSRDSNSATSRRSMRERMARRPATPFAPASVVAPAAEPSPALRAAPDGAGRPIGEPPVEAGPAGGFAPLVFEDRTLAPTASVDLPDPFATTRLAERLAALLDEEADLRGVAR